MMWPCGHPELRLFAIRSGEARDVGLQKQNSRFLARPRLRLRTTRNDKGEKQQIPRSSSPPAPDGSE